ncbi:rpsF [Symbiodinium sp. CCMP2592]|nr:rpsF [Symbiodinium sp. CCMP2592]CAE7698343.1 rpsF [Symbiodinium sp. CCMP2592]
MAEVVAAANPAPQWKSVRPGKIAWTEKQADLANTMLANIPQNAREIFEQGRFGGGDLVVLDSLISRPGYKEIRVNYVWLRPIVQMFEDKVPSALYLTDVLLYLDGTLDKKLLVAKRDTPEALLTKQDLAGREAGKLKKLISSLRYLYRNGEKSLDPYVTELKSFLKPSPRAVLANRNRRAQPQADDAVEAASDKDSGEDEESEGGSGEEASGDEASPSMALVAATEVADGQESSGDEESMSDDGAEAATEAPDGQESSDEEEGDDRAEAATEAPDGQESSDDEESMGDDRAEAAGDAATEARNDQESSDDEESMGDDRAEAAGDAATEARNDQESSDDEESMGDDRAEAAGDEASHGMALVAATEVADGQESSDNEESMGDGKDSSDDESIKGPVETWPKEVTRSELQKMLAQFDSDDEVKQLQASDGEDRSDLAASEGDQDSDFEEGLTDAETLVLGQSKDDDEDTVPDWYEAWRSPSRHDEAEDDCSVHDVPEYGEPSPPMLKRHKFFVGPKEPMPDHESRKCWPVAMDDNGVAVKGHVLVPPEEHPLCKPRFLRDDEDSASKPAISEP